MIYTHERYNGLATYVTENGLSWEEDNAASAVNDTQRQSYISDHVDAVGKAIQFGCNVKGYFVWSLQDNLEWNSGSVKY